MSRVQRVVRPYHSYELDPFDFSFSSILIGSTVTNQGSHISFGQQRAGGCSEACVHKRAKPSTLCWTVTRTDCCQGAVSLLLLYGFCIVHFVWWEWLKYSQDPALWGSRDQGIISSRNHLSIIALRFPDFTNLSVLVVDALYASSSLFSLPIYKQHSLVQLIKLMLQILLNPDIKDCVRYA